MKNIPGLKPGDISNFNGAVCCFFLIYIMPILIHIACYHGDNKNIIYLLKIIGVTP